MKLAKARILTLSLLLAGLAIAVAAGFLTTEGTMEYTMSLILVLLLFAAGIAVAFFFGRCPNCGKHLFVNFLRLSRCPHCGKLLEPGESGQESGRKENRKR